ncbi:MAG: serine/threonine protein kinase, partial [Deltaproteobacteria bacterium]|nr:serine/threonine protein kinase [Deltaproteobacteria bacterium]
MNTAHTNPQGAQGPASLGEEGRVIGGRYRLVRPLGAGGFSAVYLGVDEALGREVAVKVLRRELSRSPAFCERFTSEARVCSRLRHPHTLKLFDFGQTDDGALFLVLELLNGELLSERLRRLGRIDERALALLFSPICLALDEAHALGVVHRDLKPDNLFFHRAGQTELLVLIDFGIAKVGGEVLDERTPTPAGQIFGTPCYMAPEQIMDTSGVSPQSDLYSLGVILYQCLTGALPFTGDSLYEVFERHLRAPVPDPRARAPEVSAEMARLVTSLLDKNPAARPASALAVRE